MEYYWAIKKPVDKHNNLDGSQRIMSCEKSQSQNFAYCMIALYNILKMTKTRDGEQIMVTNG